MISTEFIGLINGIRDDKTHGASELARQALTILKTAAEKSRAKDIKQFRLEQQEIGQSLMAARPSMAPIYNAVSRLLYMTLEDCNSTVDSLRDSIINKADELVEASLRSVAKIAGHVSDLITEHDIIMTHSYSSTVVKALSATAEKHNIQLIVTRSGAGRTGERAARELSSAGIQVTFVDDTAMGIYVPKANKVLVGADRICADGGLVNGIGTYLLALTAEKINIPFYVLCETLKFDARLNSSDVELEEKEPSEVTDPHDLPEKVMVRNPYFDVTPLELVNGIITEDGLVKRKEFPAYFRSLTAAKASFNLGTVT